MVHFLSTPNLECKLCLVVNGYSALLTWTRHTKNVNISYDNIFTYFKCWHAFLHIKYVHVASISISNRYHDKSVSYTLTWSYDVNMTVYEDIDSAASNVLIMHYGYWVATGLSYDNVFTYFKFWHASRYINYVESISSSNRYHDISDLTIWWYKHNRIQRKIDRLSLHQISWLYVNKNSCYVICNT